MKSKNWIKILFINIIMIIIFIGSLNYLIDPYGLNSSKNKFDESLTKISKPNILNLKINLNADYYLIGTSRLMNVNPNLLEKYLPKKRVYNINISGATFKENSMLANKVIKNGKHIIYGFDTFSLNKNRFIKPELVDRFQTYQNALIDNSIYLEYFSSDNLTMSVKDIASRIMGKRLNQYTINENLEKAHASITSIEKHLDLSNKGKTKMFSNFEIEPDINIINLAKLASKDDVFIIYPTHFNHYILFRKYQNIDKKYFNAVKLLVNNTDAKVWSFYQLNEVTKNEKNFDQDGWHFKPKIANLIFARIFNDRSIQIPDNFGIQLTHKNINSYLENLNVSLNRYNSDNK